MSGRVPVMRDVPTVGKWEWARGERRWVDDGPGERSMGAHTTG